MRQTEQKQRPFFHILPILLLCGLLVSACQIPGSSGGTGNSSTNTAASSPTAKPTIPPSNQPLADEPGGSDQKVGGQPLPANEMKSITFNLAYNEAAMELDVAQIYKPGSPTYHRYLTPEQIIERYALPDAQYQQVQGWLKQNGYTITGTDALRSSITVQGTVATIEKTLNIKLEAYSLPIIKRNFFMQKGTPKLPAPVAALVHSIVGLNNFAFPEFGLSTFKQAVNGDCSAYGAKQTLTRDKLAAAYQLDKFHQQNLKGQGMSIGVAQFSEPYDPQDIANYMACVGEPMPQIENIEVNGPVAPGPGAGEAAMDIELIAGLAPQAKLFVYQASLEQTAFAQALVEVFTRVAADRKVQVLSVSYGAGESMFSPSEQTAINRSLRILAAEGIAVFIASGDCGAYSFRLPNVAMVAFPASAPYAIAVGGTHLQVNDNNVRTSETVWADNDGTLFCQNQWGTGGGVSQNEAFKRPEWQVGQGTTSEYDGASAGVFVSSTFPPTPLVAPNGLRQVPDIAASAHPNNAIYYQGAWVAGGGTSASAPILAAGTLLLNQALQQQGKTMIGSVPDFYTLANTPEGQLLYTDITQGDNLFYPATPGWDYTTGWGAPKFYEILQVMQK